MNRLFCNQCNVEKDIVNSGKKGAATFYLLSCGHRSLVANFTDSFKLSESFDFMKKGKTNIKYSKSDHVPNINYAKKFLQYGDTDYEAAAVLFNIQNRNYDFMNQAAFLSAQAVEKYLKAFLFWNSLQHYPNLSGKQILNEFKSLSHDLIKILNECVKDNADFNKFRSQIENLNKYSLLKYPDVEDQMVYSDDGLSISSDISKDVKQIGNFIKELLTEKS